MTASPGISEATPNLSDPSQLRDLIPFAAELGIELLEAAPQRVRGRLTWAPKLTTTAETMHGGAIMALADTCGAVCAFLNLPQDAQGTSTIESTTNFMRAVKGGAVTATSTPLNTGRTLIVVETEIVRDDGKLAAKVTQIQIYQYAH